MAAPAAAEHSSGEVFPWLKTLPTAPEYHPTIQEFQDPISYIFRIEKEASRFGICKIVPPVPPQPKKTVISNFNRSLSKRSSSPLAQNPKSQPTFTTRQQQVGFCPRKHRPVQKPVWQSGEHYTLNQFESKAKGFEKNYLKNRAKKAPPTALEFETLYWKANGDRPFSVEYANDMPGSAFMAVKDKKLREGAEAGVSGGVGASNVGETSWNMRGISRSSNSVLRFMREEIPGVTSPMVYVAMLFSWFAWHVEDHDLHSLNYLHMGASKTWYGVPRDAATAFEEVIRVQGYGGETNPLVTFSTLGEKTTVMSPEVLIKTGVPCCRLVQNAGEFVVTFPRAYHSGFSHGYNVGEASNIATPEWLLFARDAAIRRAAINYPPMVSHSQLLYDLAMALNSSSSVSGSSAPRSSRLKDKKKGEGEALIKKLFVEDVMQNNALLQALGKGESIVLLPHNSSEKFACSNLRVESGFGSKSDGIVRKTDNKQLKTFYSTKAKFPSEMDNGETETERSAVVDGLSDRGLFSCVKCGIWPFACVAILQPTESASRYLMSADTNFHDLMDGESHGVNCPDASRNVFEPNSGFESGRKVYLNNSGIDSIRSSCYQFQKLDDESFEMDSHTEKKKESSALGLLALAYGNSSDSDEDDVKPEKGIQDHISPSKDVSLGSKCHSDNYVTPSSLVEDTSAKAAWSIPSSRYDGIDYASPKRSDFYDGKEFSRVDSDCSGFGEEEVSNDSLMTRGDNQPSPNVHDAETAAISDPSGLVKSPSLLPLSRRCDDDSSRMHVFCLEHAAELEQKLCQFGGVQIMLLCHPDYPKVESAAKQVAEEQEMGYGWSNISFRTATKEDEEEIQLALLCEEETPKNGDWTVKLGINLYHTALLCRSPLYNKQMPYSSVIYNAFGCTLPSNSSKPEPGIRRKRSSRLKKIIMAGKWCGKVWMSNQVHPLLVKRDDEELLEVEEEGEEERTFSAPLRTLEKKRGVKPDTFYKSESTSPLPRETATCTTTSKKRKSKVEIRTKEQNRPNKKMRTQESEIKNYDSGDSDDLLTLQEQRRSLGKKKIQNRSNKKFRYHEDEVADDSDLELSVEDSGPLQDYGRSTRTKRFKARAHPQNSSQPVDKQREPTPEPESEVEGWPSSRLRKRATRPPCEDFEYEMGGGSCSLKKQSQKSKPSKPSITNTSTNSIVVKKGPKMRLPRSMRSPATTRIPVPKGPSVKVAPTMKTGGNKGPIKRAPAAGEKGVTASSSKSREKEEEEPEEFLCDVEGCSMSFRTKQELSIHKRNICPVKGCGKKFFSHKYLVQHKRVHDDDRPLKCPWKGCKMTFKWAWARTEHIRVHTGARPYVCKEPGCGQTFRFVSDFSRHKRKTGHSVKKTKSRV